MNAEGGWYKSAVADNKTKTQARRPDNALREKYPQSQLIGDN